jgi:hypothetical protein
MRQTTFAEQFGPKSYKPGGKVASTIMNINSGPGISGTGIPVSEVMPSTGTSPPKIPDRIAPSNVSKQKASGKITAVILITSVVIITIAVVYITHENKPDESNPKTKNNEF